MTLCLSHYGKKRNPRRLNKPTKSFKLRWIMENASHIGDDCLVWPFPVEAQGNRPRVFKAGKLMLAARAMCEIKRGPPPKSKRDAAHTCGNGQCLNPNHLTWKTRKANLRDREKHGTMVRGEKCNFSKLTEQDVLAIRAMAERPRKETAAKFNISPMTVSQIVNRRAWAWLPETTP